MCLARFFTLNSVLATDNCTFSEHLAAAKRGDRWRIFGLAPLNALISIEIKINLIFRFLGFDPKCLVLLNTVYYIVELFKINHVSASGKVFFLFLY